MASEEQHLRPKQIVSVSWYALALLWRHTKSLYLVYVVGAITDGITPVLQAYLAGAILGELSKVPMGGGSRNRLLLFVTGAAGLTFMSFLMNAARSFFSTTQTQFLELKLKEPLLMRKASLRLEEIELPKVRDQFDLAESGINAIQWYSRSVMRFFSAVISIIGILLLVLKTVPWLVVILLPLAVFTSIVKYHNFMMSRRTWGDVRSHRIRVWGVEMMFRNSTSIMELRLFGLTKKLLAMWRQESMMSNRKQIDDEKRSLKQNLITDIGEAFVGVCIDIWLVVQVFARVIPINIFEQTRRLVGSYVTASMLITDSATDLVIDGYRINDYRAFLQQVPENEGRTRRRQLLVSPQNVSLDSVSFKYPMNEHSALDAVSLDVPTRRHIAIVGENGAGKTTLLKVLLGLYRPTRGRVLYDGIDRQAIDSESYYRFVTPLLQDFSKFDFMTVTETVAIGDSAKKPDETRVLDTLQAVGMKDFILKLPKGIESNLGYVEDDGIKLSGGQWQRLAIARALYKDAEIMVLDEPTSALDAKSELEIIDEIFERYKGKTVFIVSHRISTVKRADHIIVMKDGRVEEQGTHKELFHEGTAYYDLFAKQAKAVTD